MTEGEDEAPDFTYVEEPPVPGVINASEDQGAPNAAEKEGVAAQRAKIKRAKNAEADLWQRVLSEEIGRKVIWEMLAEEGLFKTAFGASPVGFPDPNQTFFNMGRKDVATRLYAKLMLYDRVAVGIMHDEHDPAYQVIRPKKAKD